MAQHQNFEYRIGDEVSFAAGHGMQYGEVVRIITPGPDGAIEIQWEDGRRETKPVTAPFTWSGVLPVSVKWMNGAAHAGAAPMMRLPKCGAVTYAAATDDPAPHSGHRRANLLREK